jgi:hypothetical protein
MSLLDYAFYMHWRQFEMLWFSVASKLGFGCYYIYALKTDHNKIVPYD